MFIGLIILLVIGVTILGAILGMLAYLKLDEMKRQMEGLREHLSRAYERIILLESELGLLKSGPFSGPAVPDALAEEAASDPMESTVSAHDYFYEEGEREDDETVTPPPVPAVSVPLEVPELPVVRQDLWETTPATHTPPPVPEAERPGPDPFPWKELLRQVHLLPPESENTEANVAAWWSTRVGIILAVIALIFFAVYVSQGTAPWVKFLELLLASFGVTGLGYWLGFGRQPPEGGEGKLDITQYGQVIFSGGLTMIFISVYAGYSFEPVRVLDSPLTAAILQFLAATGIMGVAVWLGRKRIAVLSAIFGFVACWFAQFYGLHWFVLLSLGALGLIYAALFVWRGWLIPALLALIGCFGTAATLIVNTFEKEGAPGFEFTLACLAAYFLIFLSADVLSGLRNHWATRHVYYRRIFLSGTSGLALLCGLIYYNLYSTESLHRLYLVVGTIFAGIAYGVYQQARFRYGFHNYFLKGSSLIALGLITYLDGPAQWFSLMIQSGAMLISVRAGRSGWLQTLFYLVLLSAFVSFVVDLRAGAILASDRFLTVTHAWCGGFLLLMAGLLTFQGACLKEIGTLWDRIRGEVTFLWALILAGCAIGYVVEAHESRVAGIMAPWAYALVFAGLSVGLRNWVTGFAAIILLLFSHFSYQLSGELPLAEDWQHIPIALALAVLSASTLAWVRWGRQRGVFSNVLPEPWIVWLSLFFVIVPVFRAAYTGCQSFLDQSWPASVVFALFTLFSGACLWGACRYVSGDEKDSGVVAAFDLTALISGGLVVALAVRFYENEMIGLSCLLAAAVLGGAAYGLYSKRLLVLSTVPLLSGLWVVWIQAPDPFPYQEWLTSYHGPALLGILILIGYALGFRRRMGGDSRSYGADFMVWALAIATLQIFLFQSLSPAWALCLSFLLALGLIGSGVNKRFAALADVQWLLPVGGLVASAVVVWGDIRDLEGGFIPLWLTTVCAAVYSVPRPSGSRWLLARSLNPVMMGFLLSSLWGITYLMAASQYDEPELNLLLLSAGVLAAAGMVGFRPAVGRLLWFYLFSLLTLILALAVPEEVNEANRWTLLGCAVLGCLSVFAGALLARPSRLEGSFSSQADRVQQWIMGLFVLVGLFATFLMEAYDIGSLTTIFWGLTGIVFFLGGFFFKSRPYRILGLIGLGLCLPRMFIVDITDGFYRILAFGAVAIVLLAIGFLYSKFKDRIEL